MTDERAQRIAEFIEPLRVRPGSTVDLAHDFDPAYRSEQVRKKKDGVELLRAGVDLLADYQARLAAQNTYGVLMCLQALDAGSKDGTKEEQRIRFLRRMDVPERMTFLGASVFDIAGGEPFTPAQVLWIHFFVNAAFGAALGFDREEPGLMGLRPRPRGQSVLTRDLVATVALTGLYIGACQLVARWAAHTPAPAAAP
ncbi:cation-translocating P-type ATPase C-terminal domain-containing protein [Pseudonocardia xinjiangensis]|uniref:cation-translocating P-type ATPase C-terminal domain-containing protein n=1 Tax=Pseudonocardia xinjiangensis TaxID=75289 RepID=UPI003D8DA1FA